MLHQLGLGLEGRLDGAAKRGHSGGALDLGLAGGDAQAGEEGAHLGGRIVRHARILRERGASARFPVRLARQEDAARMASVDGFNLTEIPPLRSPVVVMAFTGWSDTGTVTTDAGLRLIETCSAERFLTVDPEDYYVFTESRPTVRLDDEGERVIEWPQNEAYYAILPEAPHDLVVVCGVEPSLRWRTFSERLADVIAGLSPALSCTMVARPAATPHTRPIPISGSSADPQLAARFGLGPSLYQGPTGIIGVLHDALRQRGVPLISLAAGVPHYLNVDENPPATKALLQALRPVVGFTPDLGDLDEQGERFLARVEEASRGDDQIGQYVTMLEQNYGQAPETPAEFEEREPGDLPPAADILRDVEDFLRGTQ